MVYTQISNNWLANFRPKDLHLRAKRLLRQRKETWQLKSLLRSEFGTRYRPISLGPAAPGEVIERTALMHASEKGFKSRADVFYATGAAHMFQFLKSAQSAGFRIPEMQSAFELGCGGGRLIRHLRGIEGLELVGSDVIPENVNWCKNNLDGIQFFLNQLKPPLGFASSDHFDFAFAYSVFTHIPFELQRPWADELARILRPSGVAAITVLSDHMAQVMLNEEQLAEYRRAGVLVLDPNGENVSYSTKVIGSWDTFLSEDKIKEIFGHRFEIVSLKTVGHSILVLKKKENR